MAVNEEGIYVTGMSLKEVVIDKYSNGDEEEIGANFIGSIASYQSEIYGINSMVRFMIRKMIALERSPQHLSGFCLLVGTS